MMLRKPQLWLVCVAVAGALSVGSRAFAQQISVDYEPKKGHSATYDVVVHSEASDTAGFSLAADMTSTVALKITEVTRDKSIPVGKNNIVGITTELTRKNGSVKVLSGKTEKTFPIEDATVQLVSDGKGMVKEAPAGMDKAILDLVSAVYAQVGKGAKLTAGQEWKMPLAIPCGNETVPVEVTWTLVGRGSVAGLDCVLVSSAGKAAQELKEGPMKKVSIEWTGEAAYAFSSGKFARIALNGTSAAALEDDATAQGKFSFEMVLAKKQASLPHTGVLAGFVPPFNGGSHLPMLFGAVLLIGLFGAAMIIEGKRQTEKGKRKTAGLFVFPFSFFLLPSARRTLRQAFAAAMVIALAVYGMPINTAEAATPGALLAFANLMNQAAMNAAGWTAGGGAGVCINGARAASMGVPASSTAPWAASGFIGVMAGLTPDFVQPAVVEAPAAAGGEEAAEPVGAAAGAGIFSGTNLLIGGGVLLAGGGIAAAAGGGGGGGGGAAAPDPDESQLPPTLTDIKTDQANLMAIVGPAGDAEVPPDRVTIMIGGNVVAGGGNLALNVDNIVVLPLDPGANTLTLQAMPGGGNSTTDVNIVFTAVTAGNDIQAVSIPIGSSSSCTITLE